MKKFLSTLFLLAVFSGMSGGLFLTTFESASAIGPQQPTDFDGNIIDVGPTQPNAPTGPTQPNAPTGPIQPNAPTGPTQPNAPTGPTQSGFSFSIANPFADDSLMCVLYRLFNIFMNIFAIVAGLYVMYAGFKFVAAQGNPAKLQIARQNFYNVLIGTALILGSWGLVVLTINTINEVLEEPIASVPSSATCPD